METYNLKAMFSADASGFVTGITGVLGSLSRVENKVGQTQSALSKLTTPLAIAGGAFGLIGGTAVSAFKDVEAGAKNVIRATGATGKEAQAQREIYKDLSDEVVGSFEDIGSTVGAVKVRFGQSGKALKDLSKSTQQYANITGQQGAPAITAISQAMRRFNVDDSEAVKVMGLFAKTAQKTGKSAQSLQEGVYRNADVLHELGFGLGQGVQLMAAFEEEGVDGAVALQGWKIAAKKCAAEGVDFKGKLQELATTLSTTGKGTKEHAEAAKEAGKLLGRGGLGFIALAEQGKINLDNLSNDLDAYKDVVKNTANETIDDSQRMELAWKGIKTALAPIGATVLEAVAPVISKMAKAFQKMTKFASENFTSGFKKFIVYAGLITVTGAPLIGILAKIGSKIKGLKSAKTGAEALESVGKAGKKATSGTKAIKNAFAGLIKTLGKAVTILAIAGAIYIVAQAFKILSDSSIKLASQGGLAIGVMAGMVVALGALMVIASKVGIGLTAGAIGFVAFGAGVLLASAGIALILSVLPPVIDALINFGTAVLPLVTQALQTLGDAIVNVINALGTNLVAIIQAIGSVIIGTINAICGGVIGIVLAIGSTIVGIVNAIGGQITSIISAITTGISTIISAVATGISTIIQTIGTTITNIIKTTGEAIKSTVEGICNGIKTIVEGIGNAIKGIVEGIGNAISNIINSIANVVKALVDLGSGPLENIASQGKGAADAISSIGWAMLKLRGEVSAEEVAAYGTAFESIGRGASSLGGATTNATSSVTSLGATCTQAQIIGVSAFNMLKSAGDLLKAGLTSSFNAIKSSASSSFNSVRNSAQNGFRAIPQIASSAINSALSAIRSGVSQMSSLGYDMGTGFANGMRNSLGEIEKVAEKMAEAAEKAVKAKAKIGSPSKVMKKLGGFIGEGFAIGIKDSADLVKKASDFLVHIPTVDDYNIDGTMSMRMNDGTLGLSNLAQDIAEALETRPLIVQADVTMDSYKVGELTTDSVTQNQQYNQKIANYRQGIR